MPTNCWTNIPTRQCKLSLILQNDSQRTGAIMTTLKTGLIGCGKFANKHLANLVTMPEKFEITVFCDIVKENAEQYAQKYSGGKAGIYSDYHEMFDKTP